MDTKFYVYILESLIDQSYYIGYSKDPETRLAKHNKADTGYTAKKKPWKIVFAKLFETKQEALAYEKKLKSLKSRVYLSKLIASDENTFPGFEGGL